MTLPDLPDAAGDDLDADTGWNWWSGWGSSRGRNSA